MTTILVTAAAGHIGREIVAALSGREGVPVLAGSRRVDAAGKKPRAARQFAQDHARCFR